MCLAVILRDIKISEASQSPRILKIRPLLPDLRCSKPAYLIKFLFLSKKTETLWGKAVLEGMTPKTGLPHKVSDFGPKNRNFMR